MTKKITFLFLTIFTSSCITSETTGFVNYRVIGGVYATEPQAFEYEEIGTMSASDSGFIWTSCDDLCRDAVGDLKYKSQDRGGDYLINVTYEDNSRTPTCVTTWSWAFIYGVGILMPWVKECEVQGIAIDRIEGSKGKGGGGNKNETGININISNTANDKSKAE